MNSRVDEPSIPDTIVNIWSKPRSSVVKDLPRLSSVISVWQDDQLLSPGGPLKTTLEAIITALGDQDLLRMVQAEYEQLNGDLELLMQRIGWQSEVGNVLKLLTQSIPAPVSVRLIENMGHYNLQQGQWAIHVRVFQEKVVITHIRFQSTAIAIQPNSATVQKNFTFQWQLWVIYNRGATNLSDIRVLIPSDEISFAEDLEKINNSWKVKVHNLLGVVQALSN
jgi:hypothetical protein